MFHSRLQGFPCTVLSMGVADNLSSCGQCSTTSSGRFCGKGKPVRIVLSFGRSLWADCPTRLPPYPPLPSTAEQMPCFQYQFRAKTVASKDRCSRVELDSPKQRAQIPTVEQILPFCEPLDRHLFHQLSMDSALRIGPFYQVPRSRLASHESNQNVASDPPKMWLFFSSLYVGPGVKYISPKINGYAKSVNIVLRQNVLLSRNPSTIVRGAITWESFEAVGLSNPTVLQKDIRATVADCVDEFINAFLAANPK